MFTFGVDSFIWAEVFSERDLWIIPTEKVRRAVTEAGIRVVTTTTLNVEPVNRFETHFLNIAEDAVRYCRDVGTSNMKVRE